MTAPRRRTGSTVADLRRFAAQLPEVEAGSSWGGKSYAAHLHQLPPDELEEAVVEAWLARAPHAPGTDLAGGAASRGVTSSTYA